MPRQSRGPAPAPRRPTAPAPARPAAPQQQQTRSASTLAPTRPGAQPPAAQAPPVAATQSQGPGLFGQMASTAAGVAVGSSIGHAIGGFFGGGSSSAASQPAAVESDPALQQGRQQDMYYTSGAQTQADQAYSSSTGVCATDVKNFRSCMDENQGNLTICGWYLDKLKACQAAAAPY